MTGEIRAGSAEIRASGQTRNFVPLKVGSATVYVEQFGAPAGVETGGEIRPVAPSPEQAFQTGSEALKECVRVIGESWEKLAEKRPEEVSVEFTLSFEVKGKAALIPVLLTGESTNKAGLTVKAVWRRTKPENA